MRKALKIALLRHTLGRALYNVFRQIRAIWLLMVIYSGRMMIERMNTIMVEQRLTEKEAVKALDRIRKLYSTRQHIEFEQKVFRKHR